MSITLGGRHEKRIVLFVLGLGLVAVHLWTLTKLRFEVWPEMLVMPYLQQNGFELYRDMVVPWTPGLMWVLQGWFNLAGLAVDRLKVLTWGLIAGIDFLIFFIAGKKWGEKAGLAALAFFALLQPIFDGNGLWFDLAVIPFLLLVFYWRQPLLLGPAFLVKQSAMWLLFPFIINPKKILLGILGILGGLGISAIYFFFRGTMGDYWFWAYDFAFLKLPAMTGHRDLGNWRLRLFVLFPFFVVGAMRFMKRNKRDRDRDSLMDNPLIWAFLSIPFALPRFGLFHFQPAIAFLALAFAFFLTGPDFSSEKSTGTPEPRSRALATHGRRPWEQASVLLGLVMFLSFSWARLLRSNWHKPDRFLESEVYQLAAKVALETKKEEPVLLVNVPELVYLLADRLPPKPWLTQFPWFLELPGFQEMLIEKFASQDLRQVVVEPYKNEGEFIPGSYRPKILLEFVGKIK